MALAPIVLRRMARRQSGSAVAAARERIMSKGIELLPALMGQRSRPIR
jgi:hypothetical protein